MSARGGQEIRRARRTVCVCVGKRGIRVTARTVCTAMRGDWKVWEYLMAVWEEVG